MKRIYILVFFIFFMNVVHAQVCLIGVAIDSLALHSLDSNATEVAAIKSVTMNDPQLLVLSASDTGLKTFTDSTFVKKNSCVVAFIGCDETHYIISDFVNTYYAEYLNTHNYETSFFKAKTDLFNKYPNSPVTPILRCN